METTVSISGPVTMQMRGGADVGVSRLVRPRCVPPSLWVMLAESEKLELAPEDGGYLGFVPVGPWRCCYFTTWNAAGNPIATYDKTADGWSKRDWPRATPIRTNADASGPPAGSIDNTSGR